VTLADISDLLLAFAAFRCRKRGLVVHALDLKQSSVPADAFDVALCFDVLEHIPDPLPAVRRVRNALHEHGLFVLHAPFGEDPDHPMHVVHRDVVTPRMRSLGFRPVDCQFPASVRAPQMYRKEKTPAVDRLGYYLYDGYLNNSTGARLAAWYRHAKETKCRA
jgi:SAM-dependent methyltransferase